MLTRLTSRSCMNAARCELLTQGQRVIPRKLISTCPNFRAALVPMVLVAVLAFSCLMPCPAIAQTKFFLPGEYGADGNTLWIAPVRDGKQRFTIDSVGGNHHICTVKGDLKNGQARLVERGLEEEGPCIITFTKKAKGIVVGNNESFTCRTYCGARAGFTGFYPRVPKGCDRASREKAHADFARFFAEKRFAKAETRIRALLDKNCALAWGEEGDLRNELAQAQAEQGHWKDCRKTLQPYAEDIEKSEEALSKYFGAPASHDTYRYILENARKTLTQCQQ